MKDLLPPKEDVDDVIGFRDATQWRTYRGKR
jgi:hypothetical protein